MVSDSWPLGWERVDFCPFNPPAARGDECIQCAGESPPFSRGPLASHTQTLLSGACLCPASWSCHPRPTQNPQPLLPVSARPPGKGWSPVVPTPTPGAFKSTLGTAPGPRCSADTALCPSVLAAAQGLLQDPAAQPGAGGVTSTRAALGLQPHPKRYMGSGAHPCPAK